MRPHLVPRCVVRRTRAPGGHRYGVRSTCCADILLTSCGKWERSLFGVPLLFLLFGLRAFNGVSIYFLASRLGLFPQPPTAVVWTRSLLGVAATGMASVCVWLPIC